MYSSNSQDYAYNPDASQHQPVRRNEGPHSSQMNYAHTQFVGSTHPNSAGHLQMPYSNEIYGMAPPLIQDTAESIQRDFDQFMRDTAGSRAPFPSATPYVHPHRQHPYATAHPNGLNGAGHGHAHSRGGKQTILPASARGTESSTSSATRSRHPLAGKPYAEFCLAKQQTIARTDQIVNKDARIFPAQLPAVMEPGPLAPIGYVVVPQGIFSCGPATYQPIEFTPLEWKKLGNKSIRRLIGHHYVENALDVVLSGLQEIMIKIQWPGYSHFPFETRIRIKRGSVTRVELVHLVCGAVVDFVDNLKDNGIAVNKDLEEWKIGKEGLKMNKFFVPRLIHRGGNYFQPEIWVPE